MQKQTQVAFAKLNNKHDFAKFTVGHNMTAQ